MVRRVVVGVALAIGFAAAPAIAQARGVSADGSEYVFGTSEVLDPADQDNSFDTYVWSNGTSQLVSIGPAGGQAAFGAGPRWISADGDRVLFMTDEQLVSEDGDTHADVYERHGGQTRLVSTGPANAVDVQFESASDDATRVVFSTRSAVVPQDTDDDLDIYVRAGGETTLVSTSRPGTESFDRHYVDSSGDASVVLEETAEAVSSLDVDEGDDLYAHSGGTARLVTTGSLGPGATSHSNMVRGEELAVSEDGSSVVFETTATLEPGDVDGGRFDLYQRKDGRTRLITGTQQGAGPPCRYESQYYPPCYPELFAQSSDGRVVLFGTQEQLTPLDTDDAWDIHMWTGTSLELVASGPDAWLSADGSRVVFRAWDSLTPDDTNSETDVYARQDGQTTLLTPGAGAFPVVLSLSRDATRVLIDTRRDWSATDSDTWNDLYLVAPDGIGHVSTGPSDPQWVALTSAEVVSDDGSRVFWETQEALVPGDTTEWDRYTWSGGVTTLITTG